MTQQPTKSRTGILRKIFFSSTARRPSADKPPVLARMASNPQVLQASMLTGPAKLEAVTNLVDKLTEDLTHVNLLPHQRDAALEELKIYGRDPRNAEPIFTKEGIEMLTRHAFDGPSSTTSRNALRVLCNAMLLLEKTRQVFVDLGYEAKACDKLKNDDRNDEFLVSRVIFLTTYNTNIDLAELIDKHHLSDTIIQNLERHANQIATENPTADPMEEMALSETLKLLFNITHYCKEKTLRFTQAIASIVAILCKGDFAVQKPLEPPVGLAINALLNLDLSSKDVHASFFPPTEPSMLSRRLIGILDETRTAYSRDGLEVVTPLIGVIRAVHEYAPEDVRTLIREKLLPSESDRNEVLSRSESLSSWLLKHSTNPSNPELRNVVSELLFDMSDKDASKFVENVGFGFASGFLHNRNIPIPNNASEAFSNATGARAVNPITGQFVDSERHADAPPMTEAEQEREAERLFVLFERLRANGIVSAENPVRTAQQEGRFEELPDDYEEDVD
ncbi:guanine nucleotide exchange factor [Xylariaceae sp. FL0016]|nr:guanine nucleotide exchange factor [Xylariaceae sp. FL0016]